MSYADPLSEFVGERVRAEWCDTEIEGTVEAVTYHDCYAHVEPTLILSVGESRIAVSPECITSNSVAERY